MEMSHNNLQVEVPTLLTAATAVPLATEADFDNPGRPVAVALYQKNDSDSYAYFNAETCPDCGGGMIRQGRCCACPSCGFESCVI